MGFDLRDCCCGREGGAVYEERFLLDGCVWYELVGGYVIGGESEVRERSGS